MRRLVVLLLVSFASVASSDEGVDITDPAQVSALLTIQEKLDVVSTGVMGCMDSGKSHEVCMCENKAKILDFNAVVKDLFVRYPKLNTLDLVHFKSADGARTSQSLVGIKIQASTEPSCTE